MINFKLSEPTVFAMLNQKEGKDNDFSREEIALSSLKYKHFRSVLQHPAEDQMHHLMIAMTGLTEEDVGELSPNDAAGLSKLVFDSMKKYMELGKQIIKGME